MSEVVEKNFHSSGVEQRRAPVGGKSKRFFDLTFATILLLITAPLFVVIAVCVLANRHGGIVFRHRRLGFQGQEFDCYKFRSMVPDADVVLRVYLESHPEARQEWQLTQKLKCDPRVTPTGRILRSLSLDELPQLANVIKGDMSLVGPRPVVRSEAERFGPAFEVYKSARPGMTGPWQVSGRSDCSYEQRVRHDSDYVANWSMLRDMVIIGLTAKVVLSQKGSY